MKSIQQITLRLPDDLAKRLAACTPSRKRNQFVVELVRRELDRESRELEEAAQRLSELEAAQAVDDSDWLDLDHSDTHWGEFDEERFLNELAAKHQSPHKAPRRASA
jgi:hypothetical protein